MKLKILNPAYTFKGKFKILGYVYYNYNNII